VAEKPSVARDIARVLGATKQGQGYLYGNGYVVTWAVGHLVALAQPHEINPQWRQWRRDLLPILPDRWPLVVYEQTKDQFEVVRRLLSSPKIASVVCATDAGREGELIFRYIYEAAACEKPFSRLWISSLTPDAIRKGFATLRPGSDYDALGEAARGRSRADWLVGMNLSRAYSIQYREELSVGRVQTPTLAMLVERELAIRSFVPEDYIEVVATFRPEGGEATYRGTWFRGEGENATRLAADGAEAERVVGRARSGRAAIESIKGDRQRAAPPPLYDLTELQRHANRLFGFSAQKTLDLAQALYERHKLISYPRTDSRHLSTEVSHTLPRVVAAIEAPYREHLAPGTGERPLGRRFVDDAKVTDHHAIIPTVTSVERTNLPADERRIYDLICRRLLSAWHDDHVWLVTTVATAITSSDAVDRYRTSGTAVEQVGWKVLEVVAARKTKPGAEEQSLPSNLAQGQRQEVTAVEAVKKKTRPPKRFTDATLLTAMETAGKTLDEKELSDAMKETGLGTPATRAAIIEVLVKRGYIVRAGKALEATGKGINLIEVVHPEVKSPAMTGQWEAYLKRIERGRAELGPFIKGIEDYVREVVGKVGQGVKAEVPALRREALRPAAGPAASSEAVGSVGQVAGKADRASEAEAPREAVGAPREVVLPAGASAPPEERVSRPAAGVDAGPTGIALGEILHSRFGFAEFRANQEEVCRAAIDGKDVLLVMPTGSGKSLCYQLPGIARGGTTLVISPLIALMEDQVAALQARGFAAERIHSGRDRAASRQVCIDYLNGRLQFLFIAPERLRVAGFPEMLAKRKLALVAIDEAHCISQWGHDFRPDYRMIGQYLPTFRPAPVIGLTATATPLVQDDIATQLGLDQPARFIRGFRRANIAIEVVEAAPSQRTALVEQVLAGEGRRPAIVYTPTRKQAEAVAAVLAADYPAEAYHAGLDGERRQRVQEAFQRGEVEVVVATIAFGMGIDKADVRTVIHTALPGSVEAYYQEIGRAGRDGGPSRAILMHSYADRYTHDFFYERDYPEPAVLDRIFARLGAEPLEKDALKKQVRMDAEVFDKALEKLWIHGGAIVDYAENVTRGEGGWRASYIAMLEQKRAQIDLVIRYAESNHCRMSSLVRHFGDLADAGSPCGICDFCAPDDCVAQRFRKPTEEERAVAVRVVAALRASGARATGKLHQELCPARELTRDAFEEVLGALGRAGVLKLAEETFEKDGKQIPYRKASLARSDAEEGIEFVIKAAVPAAAAQKRKKKKKAVAATGRKSKPRHAGSGAAQPSTIEDALRAWRLGEAKRRGVPAFRIFSDTTLHAIAEARPQTAGELLAIPGIGMHTIEKYGAQIYRLVSPG
jgi:DNA topoisomerase-3